ncbi:hypothetical protein J3459_017105 [Metarhizium acridum]|nr:hypothetical protein J3459_017105 [Metarhizium acridum]
MSLSKHTVFKHDAFQLIIAADRLTTAKFLNAVRGLPEAEFVRSNQFISCFECHPSLQHGVAWRIHNAKELSGAKVFRDSIKLQEGRVIAASQLHWSKLNSSNEQLATIKFSAVHICGSIQRTRAQLEETNQF